MLSRWLHYAIMISFRRHYFHAFALHLHFTLFLRHFLRRHFSFTPFSPPLAFSDCRFH
jgi:hypothetical protein